jgi:hypothetical protein
MQVWMKKTCKHPGYLRTFIYEYIKAPMPDPALVLFHSSIYNEISILHFPVKIVTSLLSGCNLLTVIPCYSGSCLEIQDVGFLILKDESPLRITPFL